MVEKVHGHAKPGMAVGRQLDFFILTVPTAEANLATASVLDKVVEVISLRGQPIILAAPTASGANTVLKFATEHTGAWTADTLEAALRDHGNATGRSFANAQVTIANSL